MITVQDVYFTYPSARVEALKGVSLTIGTGEFVAIMGQNGAGKTTLVKQFNGLLKPSKGKVIVGGVNTRDISIAQLARKVGFVFQNPDHQLFSETVEEEVGYALKNFGFNNEAIDKRVKWALNLLNLREYRKTSPFMLSGGERKRVALASVIAWDPEVVILDEPTIGQDNIQKETLRQFIIKLKSQGKTVVIVTHDIEFVAECNPRVILMVQGQIVADGEAKQILTNPDVALKAFVVPPQITQIFQGLTDLGFPSDVIDVCDAGKILIEHLNKEKSRH